MRYAFSSTKSIGNAVYMVAAKRTPIASCLGKLVSFSATDLGGFAIKGTLESIKLDPSEVDEVIMGNVLSTGVGQAPARQASIKGGLGVNVPCTTVNKVCSSGMKSIVFGAQSIALGQSDVVVAGGFESMSNAPFFLNARRGYGYGDQKLFDTVTYDGLTDSFNKIHMGLCAEKTAKEFKVTREQQDQYCMSSYQRHIEAVEKGLLAQEIVPVTIKTKTSEEEFAKDEEVSKYKQEKVRQLKPAFTKTDGTITAANASKINDGAAAMVLMSESKMKALNLKPLGRLIAYADAEIDPIDFSISPMFSSKKVLSRAGLKLSDIDYFQFNQAFSLVAVVTTRQLDIPKEKVNVHGGAVSMGHPIGMSGTRIVQSLLTVLRARKGRYGLAAICNGGGGSTAVIVENLAL